MAVAEDVGARRIVAVGDVVYENLLTHGVKPWAAIVDGVTRRGESVFDRRGPRVRNPPGMITGEAWSAVAHVVETGGVLLVDGEEDLLAIPAILESPSDALVAYGLYLGALVAIPVNAYRRPIEELAKAALAPC